MSEGEKEIAKLQKADITYDEYEHELSLELWEGNRKVTLIAKPECAMKVSGSSIHNDIKEVEIDARKDLVDVLRWLYGGEKN